MLDFRAVFAKCENDTVKIRFIRVIRVLFFFKKDVYTRSRTRVRRNDASFLFNCRAHKNNVLNCECLVCPMSLEFRAMSNHLSRSSQLLSHSLSTTHFLNFSPGLPMLI